VKRSAHLKSKKATLTRSQQQKLKQKNDQTLAAKEKGKNIFSKKSKKPQKTNIGTKNNHFVNKEEEEDDDEAIVSNIADMLEGDDLEYLNSKGNKRQRKRKNVGNNESGENSVELEMEYKAHNIKENETRKVKINLLPIKSREGEIITRTTEIDYVPKQKSKKPNALENQNENEEFDNKDENVEYEDSDDDVINEDIPDRKPEKKLISTSDLLIAREQEIERQKYRIGIICSGILEKPEDKIRNFNALFELMDEEANAGTPNLLTVRKVAIISITELFKDILPEYRVGEVDTRVQKVKKATLERVTFENSLLQQFKKFLQKLEKLTAMVSRRGYGKVTPQSIKLAEVAVECMCDILIAHPYFNYVQNIAQLLVYMLNSNYSKMRESVNKCFRTIFANDKRLDMTLFIVRRINHLVKSRLNNVHLEVVSCLISLKIKNVNLDAEKENELKQKKLENHRQRLINLSKKERKRRKKLAELNKELEETRAEENKQTKHFKLTEIIKMVFTIYFRVLKNAPTSKILSAVLEGLAE